MKTLTYNLKGLSVYLAMPIKTDMPAESVVALIATIEMFRDQGIPYTINFYVGGTLCGARSASVGSFLKGPQNKLLFIDSDIVWTPDDVIRILAMSTVMDIVTAPYTSRQEPVQFFVKVPDNNKIPVNEHGCAKIDGMGLGFAIISRKVLAEMWADAPPIQYMMEDPVREVFRFSNHEGHFRGEDINFFMDAKKAGYQVWLDPSITLGHIGKKNFSASFRDCVTLVDGEMDLGTVERVSERASTPVCEDHNGNNELRRA